MQAAFNNRPTGESDNDSSLARQDRQVVEHDPVLDSALRGLSSLGDGQRIASAIARLDVSAWALQHSAGKVRMNAPSENHGPASFQVIRLRVSLKRREAEMLDAMVGGELAGCETRSEFIRLLIHREWNKRKRLGAPKAYEWQTAARNGRPKKL